jgi:hypothetical protein
MKMNHTPGPWNIAPCNMIESKGGDYICKIDASEGDDHHANARLIAAAPDLLEVCQKLAAWDQSDGDVNLISEACSFARAAIAKVVQIPS